jgi:two-component system, sensor histidine kinase
MGALLSLPTERGPSLRTRILLIALATMLLATAGGIATSSFLFFERMILAQQSRAEAVAQQLHVQLQRLFALGIPLNRLHGFDDQCREAVEANDGLSLAMVAAPNGQILFHSDRGIDTHATVSPPIARAIHGEQRHLRDEASGSVFTLLAIDAADADSGGTIVVGFPIAFVDAQRDGLVGASLVVSFVAIGLGMALLLWALSRYVIGPISTLVTATEGLRTGDDMSPGKRLPESDLLEFGVMARGINRLLDRVDEHESALRQAKDVAVAASRAKSTFLANMSHELRTPMNAIMGFTDLATRKTCEPKTREYLEKMRVAENQLLAVINDVLDLSSIESDRLGLQRQPVKITRVIEEKVGLVARAAQDKGLELRVDVAPGLVERTVMADPQRVGQVLLNLLGNAVKFTTEGLVVLRAAVAKEREDGGIDVRFEVEDTGIGISREERARLFSPFEQADGSVTRHYGGVGLGLAISKRIVEMMDGRIGVETEPGRGSLFWFVLPCVVAPDAEPERQAGRDADRDQEALSSGLPGSRRL